MATKNGNSVEIPGKYISGQSNSVTIYGILVYTVTNTDTTTSVSATLKIHKSNTLYSPKVHYSLAATGQTTKTSSETIGSGNTVELVTWSFSWAKGTSSANKTLTYKLWTDKAGTGYTSTATVTITVGPKTSYTISYANGGGGTAPSAQTKWYGTTLYLRAAMSRPATYPTAFTVTLNGNGGTNSSLTASRTTTYSFRKWKTGSTEYSAGAAYTANAAATMTAQWNSSTSTAAVTLPSPTRSGYSFVRWNTSANNGGSGYSGGSSYTPSGNVTLYAIWNRTVTYDANGGSGAPSSQTSVDTAAITISGTVPTRSGYAFVGWATSSGGTASYQPGGSYPASNPSVTLYAVWGPDIAISSIRRVNSSGTLDDFGGYVDVDVSVANATSGTISGFGDSVSASTSGTYRLGDGAFADSSPANAYTVTFTASNDSGSTTVTRIIGATYSRPTITSFVAARCDSSGNPDDEGTYALLTFGWRVHDAESNTAEFSVAVEDSDGVTHSFSAISLTGTSGTVRQAFPTDSSAVYGAEQQYTFSAVVTDVLSSSATASDVLSRAYFTMDVLGDAYRIGLATGEVAYSTKKYYNLVNGEYQETSVDLASATFVETADSSVVAGKVYCASGNVASELVQYSWNSDMTLVAATDRVATGEVFPLPGGHTYTVSGAVGDAAQLSIIMSVFATDSPADINERILRISENLPYTFAAPDEAVSAIATIVREDGEELRVADFLGFSVRGDSSQALVENPANWEIQSYYNVDVSDYYTANGPKPGHGVSFGAPAFHEAFNIAMPPECYGEPWYPTFFTSLIANFTPPNGVDECLVLDTSSNKLYKMKSGDIWPLAPYYYPVHDPHDATNIVADQNIIITTDAWKRGTSPSSSCYRTVEFRDSDNRRLAQMEQAAYSGGEVALQFYLLGHHTQSDQYGGFRIVKNLNNTDNRNMTYNANTGELNASRFILNTGTRSYVEGSKGLTSLYKPHTYNANEWDPCWVVQTKGGGGWSCGNYNSESLDFCYYTKALIDANNNNGGKHIYFLADGRVQAAGFPTSSDRRLKKHVSYLGEEAVHFVKSLLPAKFKMDEMTKLGFYAQDIENDEIYEADLVSIMGEDEMRSLDYNQLIAPLVATVQNLTKRVEELEERIKELEERLGE